ncbi:MAG: efflux RND transporter periplasmic adaptor subunit [Verrucomicrobiota bacterium]
MKRRGPNGWGTLWGGSLAAALLLAGCHRAETGPGHEAHAEKPKLVVSRPIKRDTLVTRDFVGRIQSSRNIEVRALERGYLEAVQVTEGQLVKEGDLMFQVMPLVYQAELKHAEAEAQAARLEYENTQRLAKGKVVSDTELAIVRAKYEKELADVNLAQAHLGFTGLKAPFPGLVDRLQVRKGSLVAEGDLLTTLSDNSEMWVYFNVPERDYLEYASETQSEDRKKVELVMANGQTFPHPGRINAIEAEFNTETGTIPFRADFPNPARLLRHGQTGTIRLTKQLKGAVLVPQKATFEVLDHHYVFLVDQDDKIVQQRIRIAEEVEDLFVVTGGITEKDKLVVEGLRGATSGGKAEYEFLEPEKAFQNLKLRAE